MIFYLKITKSDQGFHYYPRLIMTRVKTIYFSQLAILFFTFFPDLAGLQGAYLPKIIFV